MTCRCEYYEYIMQGITVIGCDGKAVCEMCGGHQKTARDMLELNECKHVFHIRCFLEHACAHDKDIRCPTCNAGVYDIRLSVARAFGRNSVTELIGCLV